MSHLGWMPICFGGVWPVQDLGVPGALSCLVRLGDVRVLAQSCRLGLSWPWSFTFGPLCRFPVPSAPRQPFSQPSWATLSGSFLVLWAPDLSRRLYPPTEHVLERRCAPPPPSRGSPKRRKTAVHYTRTSSGACSANWSPLRAAMFIGRCRPCCLLPAGHRFRPPRALYLDRVSSFSADPGDFFGLNFSGAIFPDEI